MRKLVSSVCLAAIFLTAALGGMMIASAGTFEEECDQVFREALEEVIQEENITETTISVVKEPLYDMSLEQLGLVYNMTYGLKNGFALVVNTDGTFRVAEFYMEAVSPYTGYTGDKVYVSLMTYLVWENDEFIETSTGLPLNEEAVEVLEEKAFSAGSTITTGSEVINYTNKTADTYNLSTRHPAYYSSNSALSNACTPCAGASIIGYYDRYYPDLAPNFTPGSMMLGFYIYTESTNNAQPIIDSLYSLMGTNSTGAGTTVDQFVQGMTSYVTGKSMQISYSSTMVNGIFSYSLTKQKLESGLPIVIFVDGFRVDDLIESTGQVGINYMVADAAHAMAGFGYHDVTYTLTSGSTRNDTYIKVATGLMSMSKGYYNIYYSTQVDECYAISIS